MTSVRMSRFSAVAHSSAYSSMTEPLLVRLALLLAVLSVPSLHGTVLYRDTVMASTGQGGSEPSFHMQLLAGRIAVSPMRQTLLRWSGLHLL